MSVEAALTRVTYPDAKTMYSQISQDPDLIALNALAPSDGPTVSHTVAELAASRFAGYCVQVVNIDISHARILTRVLQAGTDERRPEAVIPQISPFNFKDVKSVIANALLGCIHEQVYPEGVDPDRVNLAIWAQHGLNILDRYKVNGGNGERKENAGS